MSSFLRRGRGPGAVVTRVGFVDTFVQCPQAGHSLDKAAPRGRDLIPPEAESPGALASRPALPSTQAPVVLPEPLDVVSSLDGLQGALEYMPLAGSALVGAQWGRRTL